MVVESVVLPQTLARSCKADKAALEPLDPEAEAEAEAMGGSYHCSGCRSWFSGRSRSKCFVSRENLAVLDVNDALHGDDSSIMGMFGHSNDGGGGKRGRG